MSVQIGDKLQMVGVPFIVTVLELGDCEESGCDRPVFRFADPVTGDSDWMHVDEFEVTG